MSVQAGQAHYTTLGMATDQGRTAAVNALALLAELAGRDIAAIGTTTFRPPWIPVAIGAIAGPRARDLLAALLDPGADLSGAALPHMACAEVAVGGVPARLYRLSFSGELACELGMPTDHGEALMERIMARGAPFGVTPYGTEALAVLRIEKGHPAGAERIGTLIRVFDPLRGGDALAEVCHPVFVDPEGGRARA